MHICFLLPPIEYFSPQSGGAIAHVSMSQARELIARGHRVTVLAPRDENPPYEVGDVIPLHVGTRGNLNILQRAFSARIRGTLLGFDWLYYEYYLASARKALQQLKASGNTPDAVFLFNDLQTPRQVRRLLPHAKIVLRLGNEVRTNAKDPDALLGEVDTVLTLTDYIRNWVLQTYNIDPEKVVTGINGVDSDFFSPAPDYPESEFTRGEGPLRVLFVGRIDPNKGPDIVATAVQQLKAEGRNVHLTVAGASWFYDQGGPVDPYLKQVKEQLDGISASYLGHVARKDLPAVFRAADVVGVPSRSQEPLGNVALEAMSSGCALIAARRGGLPEVCEGAAPLINPDTPEEFTGVLRKLYDDVDYLRTTKKNGRARALEYSWPRNVDILERILGAGQ